MATLPSPSLEFLEKVVDFPDGVSYNLLRPLTDYRACHVGTPLEARILYMCRQSDSDSDQEYVVKVKVQYFYLSSSLRTHSKRVILIPNPGSPAPPRQTDKHQGRGQARRLP